MLARSRSAVCTSGTALAGALKTPRPTRPAQIGATVSNSVKAPAVLPLHPLLPHQCKCQHSEKGTEHPGIILRFILTWQIP